MIRRREACRNGCIQRRIHSATKVIALLGVLAIGFDLEHAAATILLDTVRLAQGSLMLRTPLSPAAQRSFAYAGSVPGAPVQVDATYATDSCGFDYTYSALQTDPLVSRPGWYRDYGDLFVSYEVTGSHRTG